jgi:hypothetical protein
MFLFCLLFLSNAHDLRQFFVQEFAAEHGQDLDVNLSGPLEEMLHSCNPFSTTPNSSRFPILYIRPITPILYIRPITASDAKVCHLLDPLLPAGNFPHISINVFM